MEFPSRALLVAAFASCAFGFNACAAGPKATPVAMTDAMPADFRVKFSESSGPISPQYQYTEIIEFGAGSSNTVTRSAYGTRSVPIDVSHEALEQFARRMREAIREDWSNHSTSKLQPVGGGRCRLTVTMQGKNASLPCNYWEVAPQYKKKQEQLLQDILAVVPEETVKELLENTRQPELREPVNPQ